MEENQPTTKSFSEHMSDVYKKTMTPDHKTMYQVIATLEQLKSDVQTIKNEKVIETLKLPPETLLQLGITPKPQRRLKCGWGSRPLLESEIKEAFEKGETAAGAARWLGVNYRTLRKHSEPMGMWTPKPHTKGIKRPRNPELGKYPLSEILACKHPNVPSYIIREKLFRSKIKERKCEHCGCAEKRITDGKQPLLLNFVDNNDTNHVIGNMLILCYNCTFISGRGFVRRGNVSYSFK